MNATKSLVLQLSTALGILWLREMSSSPCRTTSK